MKGPLPTGSIIRLKRQGQWEYWQLSKHENELVMGGVGRRLVKGDVIHDVTFDRSGNTFNVKKSYTLQEDADWVPVYDGPKPPDSTEKDITDQVSQISGMMALLGGSASLGGFDLRQVIVDGHSVVLTPGSTSVSAFGMSWSWHQDKPDNDGRYPSVGLTEAEFADPKRVIEFARVALDEYHRQNAKSGFIPCTVCNPPMKSVERPRKRVKKT